LINIVNAMTADARMTARGLVQPRLARLLGCNIDTLKKQTRAWDQSPEAVA
jgi:hypothetical protein